jgi:hypothetical protein
MEGEALEETMKGVCTALRKIGSKAIPPNVFHFMFVGKRRYSACRVIPVEAFVQKNEVSETAADAEAGFLE